MSYCRWSSDDYQCDIYCYAACSGGYMIHVAGNRVIPNQPLPPPEPFRADNAARWASWLQRHSTITKIIMRSPRQAIDLPHAGECFNEPTATDAANRLLMLRELGYNIPQYAIDALLAEGKEEA
jgi:hypothetical protein